MPTIDLTTEATRLLRAIHRLNGIEVHSDDPPPALATLEVLGLVSLGPARGPGRAWRRATLTEHGETLLASPGIAIRFPSPKA